MTSKTENEKFLPNRKTTPSLQSDNCCSKWWHQGCPCQKSICETIESFTFRALIIFLVVLDTSLVITEMILDSFKMHYECNRNVHHASKHENEKAKERIEIWMEIAHYCSIGILILFVLELIIKIYAFGGEFWNCRRKKMEYFDAFIVITSLFIDLLFLGGEKKVLGDKLILILSFRLWRFVRIISSVSEAIHDGQEKHKEYLVAQYNSALQRLTDLLLHKTTYTEKNNVDMNSLLEHFRMIDNQLKSSLDSLTENHELTASELVAQFLEELNELENKNHDSVISVLFTRSSEV